MIVVGELKGGNDIKNTISNLGNLHELMNTNSRGASKFPDGRSLIDLNDISTSKSVYQYTFNQRMAGCTKCRSFRFLICTAYERKVIPSAEIVIFFESTAIIFEREVVIFNSR